MSLLVDGGKGACSMSEAWEGEGLILFAVGGGGNFFSSEVMEGGLASYCWWPGRLIFVIVGELASL